MDILCLRSPELSISISATIFPAFFLHLISHVFNCLLLLSPLNCQILYFVCFTFHLAHFCTYSDQSNAQYLVFFQSVCVEDINSEVRDEKNLMNIGGPLVYVFQKEERWSTFEAHSSICVGNGMTGGETGIYISWLKGEIHVQITRR